VGGGGGAVPGDVDAVVASDGELRAPDVADGDGGGGVDAEGGEKVTP